MNKIKLLYDVVMTMKDKESCKGVLKAEATKDKAKIFSADNEFERANGRTKTKIRTEVDCDGKKVKHESTTEFDGKDGGDMHCGFMRHMHHAHGHFGFGAKDGGDMHGNHMHHAHGHFHGHFGNDQRMGHGGLKGRLTGLAFILNLFNNLQVDEQEDKSAILTLDFNEIPEDLKKSFHERFNREGAADNQGHQKFMKELHSMESVNVILKIWINKDNEVEKVALTAAGKQKDENNVEHEMNMNAELSLAW